MSHCERWWPWGALVVDVSDRGSSRRDGTLGAGDLRITVPDWVLPATGRVHTVDLPG